VNRIDRRTFLHAAGAAGLGSLVGARATAASGVQWSDADAILRRIVAPSFPSRTIDVTAHGARPDGGIDSTAAFRAAIDACHEAGGGRVVVPRGRFLTGPIVLRSKVDLHLADGAVIAFKQDPAAYLPVVLTRFEGIELMNYSPFIYAFEQRDIAITGTGTLDGQADAEHWWPWKSTAGFSSSARARLATMASQGVPVAERIFGDRGDLRPNFIQPYRCQNVLIDGVSIVNSPMWEINPVLCSNVTVRGVRIRSHGPNNDGCDPECSRDVLIERCTFDTGDDCIAIKSGRNDDGRRIHTPVENIIVRDCEMKDGHGGVTIGSEVSGGARNIFVERCRMDSPRLDRALRFKTNSVRGGVIERVAMRNVTIGEVSEAVVAADFFYEEGDTGAFTPVLRDIDVRAVTSRKSRYAFLMRGYERSPIAGLRVSDCTFDGVAESDVMEHVRDVTFSNVRVNGARRDARITR
jgi:polygalacturonase